MAAGALQTQTLLQTLRQRRRCAWLSGIGSARIIRHSLNLCSVSQSTSRLVLRSRGWTRVDFGFDRSPDQIGDVGAVEAANFPNAGRRGDVDLGDEVADDVDAGEDQAAALELGADAAANLLLA